MQKVTAEKLSCWSDSYRSAYASRWSNSPVLLSLFGNHNSVRAAWAQLNTSKGRKRGGSITVGDDTVHLAESVKYISIKTPLAHQRLHLIMLHPDATAQLSPFARSFYLVGDDAPALFFPRLSRMCAVPMRPTWAPVVWEIGQAAGLITLLDGFGLAVHSIETDTEKWAAAITEAIKLGQLA